MRFFSILILFFTCFISSAKEVYYEPANEADVELQLEIEDAQKNISKNRLPASFTQGFKRLKVDCSMYASTNFNSETLTEIDSGRKLWVEKVNSLWVKAYRKNGHGYISSNCF